MASVSRIGQFARGVAVLLTQRLHPVIAATHAFCRTPTFVTCSKIASGRAVLLGDAAHAVSPNIGFGCAAALQDSEVLSRACIAAGGDVEASGVDYNDMRLDNAHMLTHVSRSIDAVQGYNYHKNVFKALRGLPYFAVNRATDLRMGKLPGVLSALHVSITCTMVTPSDRDA